MPVSSTIVQALYWPPQVIFVICFRKRCKKWINTALPCHQRRNLILLHSWVKHQRYVMIITLPGHLPESPLARSPVSHLGLGSCLRALASSSMPAPLSTVHGSGFWVPCYNWSTSRNLSAVVNGSPGLRGPQAGENNLNSPFYLKTSSNLRPVAAETDSDATPNYCLRMKPKSTTK